MRFAPCLFLFPALAGAQDVPSLQRPNPALPITDAVGVLESRLGRPGGPFAAAQLALRGREDVLRTAAKSPDPLRRLDAAYGLSGADDVTGLAVLAELLGDPDPRVAGEAYTAFRRLGPRGRYNLRQKALYGGNDAAGDAATRFLYFDGGQPAMREIVESSNAPGRAEAIRDLANVDPNLPTVEAALADRRASVRQAAVVWILVGDRVDRREAAVARILRAPSPEVRGELARAVGEEYGSIHAPQLAKLSQDPSPTVRRESALAAGRWLESRQQPTLATRLLLRLVADGDARVAQTAFDTVARLSGDSPETVSWSSRAPDTIPYRRALRRRLGGTQALRAAVVLANLRDPMAYPVLARVAFDLRAPDRLLALQAVGASGDRRATPRLLALARSKDANDVSVAYAALGRLRDPAAVPALLATVRREPQGWGISAAYALGAIGDRSATAPLLAIARRLEAGTDANYFNPLAALGGPGVGEYLVERLDHDLETTVDDAGRALIALGDPATIPSLTRIAAGVGLRAEEAKRVLTALRSH